MRYLPLLLWLALVGCNQQSVQSPTANVVATATAPLVGQPTLAPVEAPKARSAAARSISEGEIIDLILARSQAGYPGPCPCPENTDRAGRRCGGRSAYSKPGGYSPLCYASDVTAAMIAEYRASASAPRFGQPERRAGTEVVRR